MVFRIALFDSKPYDVSSFGPVLDSKQLTGKIEIDFIPENLTIQSVHRCGSGGSYDAVCCFVNDHIDKEVISKLAELKIQLILARCAGFDMIDIAAASDAGISVARVPAYSPYAVAEMAATLLMSLNRNIPKAYNRVRESNFTLNGLAGSDIYGKTMGIIGTGKIGRCFADIAIGLGCKILASDVFINQELAAKPQVTYVSMEDLFKGSDFISLHAPLTKDTVHLVNEKTLSLMKPNAIIVNTSRGKLIDSKALLSALLTGKIRGAALDVYEGESEYFFHDKSDTIIQDEVLARLQNLQNVIITSHQAFLTHEALESIAMTTLFNAEEFMAGKTMARMTNYVAA